MPVKINRRAPRLKETLIPEQFSCRGGQLHGKEFYECSPGSESNMKVCFS